VAARKRLYPNDWKLIIGALHLASEWELELARCCNGIQPDEKNAKDKAAEFQALRRRLIEERRGE